MDEAPATEWTWSDVWLLAAAGDGPSAIGLSELIAHADAINHAIPTAAELGSGLGALIAAGLLEVLDDGFRTTDDGASIRRHWTGGLFGWSESLLPPLNKLPRPAAEFPITQDEVKAAYQQYLRRTRR